MKKLLAGLVFILTSIIIALLIMEQAQLIVIIPTFIMGSLCALRIKGSNQPLHPSKKNLPKESPAPIATIEPSLSPKAAPVKDTNDEIIEMLEKNLLITLMKPEFKQVDKSALISGLINALRAPSPVLKYMFASHSVKQFLLSLYKIMPQMEAPIKQHYPHISLEEKKAYALKAAGALQAKLSSNPNLQTHLNNLNDTLTEKEENPVNTQKARP